MSKTSDILLKTAVTLVLTGGLASTAAAATNNGGNEAPVTTATSIHGTPGNTPAFGGSSASPEGNGVNGGNGIHNIAGGAPGQNGQTGQDVVDPAGTMHGGLRATTGTSGGKGVLP